MPNLSSCTRQEVEDYFDNTWTLTEVLFASLQGDAAFLTPPYHQLRHPLIFYYGHPAALYVNKLRVAGLFDAPVHAYFEHLFESGVDEMSWDDLSKNEMAWPPLLEVHAYRRVVYARVKTLIALHPGLVDGHAPILQSSPLWALFMSFEHERIHLETSSVLIRELPLPLVIRPSMWPPLHPSAARAGERPALENAFVKVAAGSVTIGKPEDAPAYGWDNEYGSRTQAVRAFQATRSLVSNQEFLAFVRAGGYREQKHWSPEGWAWRSYRNVKWPTFWVPDGPAGSQQFKLRTCFEVIELPAAWPVNVNHHEALAYCRWRCAEDASPVPYRLLTEAEHHRLRAVDAHEGDNAQLVGANLGLRFGSERAVDEPVSSQGGFHDVFGNVWQWGEDDFHPLPAFKVHPYYEDFSTPCFDGKHKMIFGGSFVSTGDEASVWARFHFRPHFFQHAGFRMARSDDGDPRCDAVLIGSKGHAAYESEQALHEYLLLHYGSAKDLLPYTFGPLDALDFPMRCAALVNEFALALGIPARRALDVGCAVGRASFELARHFASVVGVDQSASFVAAATRMKTEGKLVAWRKDEGELGAVVDVALPLALDPQRVEFRQADACALPSDLVDFDAVLLANLLCRLPNPRACLARMAGALGVVRPGGLLVLVSPYTWLEQFTPRAAWLGGFVEGGEIRRSRDELVSLLQQEFTLLEEREMPLLIREHARKYQYIVSNAQVWRRHQGSSSTHAMSGMRSR